MTLGDFKYLARRAALDKVLRDKASNIAKNPKYNGYKRGLSSIVYKRFDKKTSNTNKGSVINSDIVFENKQLPKELQKPIIKKTEK